MGENGLDGRAVPLASPDLASRLTKFVQAAASIGQIKKGANEATKALNKGQAALVLLAADAEPLEILLHLPLVCEDKNVIFVFMDSKVALGRACGVTRPVIAAAILQGAANDSSKDTQLKALQNEIETLPI